MTIIDGVIDSIQSPETTHQPIPPQVMSAPALIAYEYGNSWPTYNPYSNARPELAAKGWIISTTLTCTGPARMYDIEPGGGEIVNIGAFMRQADRRHGKPILYTFASAVQAMINGASSQGHGRGDYFIISAHANGIPHICGPNAYGKGRSCGYPQADGTQYLFSGAYDKSMIEDYVLPHAAPPKPPQHGPTGVWTAKVAYDAGKNTVQVSGTPSKSAHKGTNPRSHIIRWETGLHVAGPYAGRWTHDRLPDKYG